VFFLIAARYSSGDCHRLVHVRIAGRPGTRLRPQVAHALDLRGHGETAGPGKLGQAGITAWHDMTADIKQLADIARTEHRDVPLIAFGRSDLLAEAVRQGCREPHRL
jgi:hypothetical protein